MFLKHGILVAPETRQHLPRRLLVKRHGLFQLCRTNHRIDLRGINARMSKQRAHLLQVVPLFQHFHRNAMAEIMRLQHRIADHPSIEFA